MRDFLMLVLFVLGGLIGSIIGYKICTYDMQREAVANKAAYWRSIEHSPDSQHRHGYSEEIFSWGQP